MSILKAIQNRKLSTSVHRSRPSDQKSYRFNCIQNVCAQHKQRTSNKRCDRMHKLQLIRKRMWLDHLGDSRKLVFMWPKNDKEKLYRRTGHELTARYSHFNKHDIYRWWNKTTSNLWMEWVTMVKLWTIVEWRRIGENTRKWHRMKYEREIEWDRERQREKHLSQTKHGNW